MIRTFKALSALLSYPSRELQEAAHDLSAAIEEEVLLSPDRQAELVPFLQALTADDLFTQQETYVLLFDRTRSLSLNLFEHVHGEGRDRGAAMVSLLESYRAGGFDLHSVELPDHLPVLLEYLAHRPLDEGREILSDAAHILGGLAERLARRNSDYATLLRAIASLAARSADPSALDVLVSAPTDDPTDLAALDAAWEEAPVTFGADQTDGCPAMRKVIGRMNVAAFSSPVERTGS